MKSFLNPEGHQNSISGLKVTVILLKGLILPIGRVALGRVSTQPAKQACFCWDELICANDSQFVALS